MRARTHLALALGLGAVLVLGPIVAAGKKPAERDDPKAEGKEAPGKGKRAQQFIAAFESGDARAVSAFWTETANYVDENGREYKGRPEIEKMYEKFFARNKGMKLNIIVTSARMVGNEVAVEDGITEVTPAEGGLPSSAHFSAVLLRKDGEWYFESVRDSIPRPPSNAKHFEDLEWLLGEWTGESEKGESAKATYSWAENRNFIVSSFATTLDGLPVVGGTQWIGWDAIDKQIRSYSFYSGGGIGEAVWNKDGDTWTITVNAKASAGKKISAVNVLTRVDDDHCTWQMTKLTVDGQAVPDARPVKMKRVKAPQS
ncbi:MAG TPA: SgcJ/EcaC family oxidoreductase [Gemmataceae bacterium]|nr:SgcJ/EcaC family oxidoreductase [Gemmataceae bacterium]